MNLLNRIPVWAVFPVSLILCVSMWYAGHGWGGDFAAYIGQARALVDGQIGAYADDVRFMSANSTHSYGPTFYGWGWPLILAPVYALFGFNLTAFKALASLMLLGSGFAAYRVFRATLDPSWSKLALFVLLCSPVMVEFTNVLYSDLAFLFALYVGFALLQSWHRDGTQVRLGILLGACVFFATWTRLNGVLLLAPVGIVALMHLWRREWTNALRAMLPVAVCAVLLLLADRILPGGRSDVGAAAERGMMDPWESLRYYGNLLAGFYGGDFGRVMFVSSLPVALFGAVRDLRRRWMLQLVCLLTLILYLYFPARQGMRLLFPLLPAYCFYLALGVQELIALKPAFRRVGRAFYAVIFVHLVLLYAERIPAQSSRVVDGPYTAQAEELWTFVDSLEEDAVVLFRRPRVLHMITGRRSVYSRHWNDDVAGYLAQRRTHRLRTEPGEGATLVFENDAFRVYRQPDRP